MSVLLVAGVGVLYLIAYHTYGRYVGRRVLGLNNDSPTPAHSMEDDRDYVPSPKGVLFGHHFTSIAGTGPIVGPAIAVIWGWLPALIWVVVGSIFMGAVHDLGALTLSERHKGKSIGDVAAGIMGRNTMILFMVVIFVNLFIILAVFGLVIASIFEMNPESVFPVWMEIPIAVLLGYLYHKKSRHAVLWTVLAVLAMYVTVYIGSLMPITLPTLFGLPPLVLWVAILMIYAYVASILPVWRLLQPRDYLNGYQLLIAMALLVIGVFVAHPEMAAPAVQSDPAGAPPMLPFLFITIACGAISGFHALVGSGTSSKQLNRELDAQFIGYGGMLLEGFLATLVIVSAAAGLGMHLELPAVGGSTEIFTGREAYDHYYANWGAVKGLGAKVGAFVLGAANMIETVGVPKLLAMTLMGMFVASFAGTTMDTAMRLQRYIISEMATRAGFKPLQGRHGATSFAALSAFALAMIPVHNPATGDWVLGKGGLLLWPLFGVANQLVAALTLTLLSVYLHERRAPWAISAAPMAFMVAITFWAQIHNLLAYLAGGRWVLVLFSVVLIVIEVFVVIHAGRFLGGAAKRGLRA